MAMIQYIHTELFDVISCKLLYTVGIDSVKIILLFCAILLRICKQNLPLK